MSSVPPDLLRPLTKTGASSAEIEGLFLLLLSKDILIFSFTKSNFSLAAEYQPEFSTEQPENLIGLVVDKTISNTPSQGFLTFHW